MSETATSPPLAPDNDEGGVANVIAMPNHAPARPHPGGFQPEDGRAADPGWLDAARREAAHIEYECHFHAEAQFQACADWERRSMRMGILTAVLGALTASTIASVLGDAGMVPPAQAPDGAGVVHQLRDWAAALKLPIAVFALVAGVVAAAMRFLDPQGRAALHGAAGKRYRALGVEARQFRNLEATAGAARDSLFNHLQTMARHRAEIHEAAPVIPKRAIATTRAKAGDNACLKSLAAEAGRAPG